MSHPHEDRLLLLAYGELPEVETAQLEAHLAACASCRDQLERLERARVALDWVAAPSRRRAARWAAAGLAAAAALAAILLVRRGPVAPADGAWPPAIVWSPTAGYIAGGAALVQIDSQLTRLEQEHDYAVPR